MSLNIAKRYAKVIFNISRETGELDTVHRDITSIQKLSVESTEFKKFLQNPIIPQQKRESVLEKIFKKKVNALTYRFLQFINLKNRLDQLLDICHCWEQLYLNSKGILKVSITSTVALNDQQTRNIAQSLKRLLHKDIESDQVIDPDLIGGIRIQEGNTIFDYSFRSQLENFRKNLMTSS